ncbi:MAG: GGDEF domain-containing protein [Rhizobiaceae bacterium]
MDNSGDMLRVLRWLRIGSWSRVVILTVGATAFTTLVPLMVIYAALSPLAILPKYALGAILLMTAGIPLLLTPPIAFVMLAMLRFLTNMVDKLDQHVKIDPLTGVGCRAYFMNKVRMKLDRGGAFLMIDADHFKKLNDTWGHAVGDEALRAIAEAMQGSAGKHAHVGRLGGEEFGVYLPGADEARASEAAKAIGAAIRAIELRSGNSLIPLTASIGVAVHGGGKPLELLMKTADEFLYEAKHGGRDRFVLRILGAKSQESDISAAPAGAVDEDRRKLRKAA